MNEKTENIIAVFAVIVTAMLIWQLFDIKLGVDTQQPAKQPAHPFVTKGTTWTGKRLTLWDTSQERITIEQYDLEIGWQGDIMVTRPWNSKE
jgi:hypothetical protein